MDLSQEKNLVINISENIDFIGKRLDFFLKNKFPEFSRTHFQKLLKKKLIKVNDKVVTGSYSLKKNDIIEINQINIFSHENDIKKENIPLDIIYEDEDIAVINKPSNMVVHPACGNYTGTLVNALMFHFSNLPTLDKSFIRPGIVHRLDKETSGVMIITKNEFSMIALAKQFETRKIKKEYLAICYKKTDLDEGRINIKIARSKIDRKKMDVSFDDDINAKISITNFKVLEKYKENLVLIKAIPETGRTHQIRVHLSYIGYPILNDSVYGIRYKTFKEHFPNFTSRTLLHAKSISFFHPRSKKLLNMEVDLPSDFQEIINFYNKFN